MGQRAGVGLLFFVAAIVQTWPLALHAGNSISDWPVRPEDSWSNLWNLWWVKHALIDLRTNPFYTDLLFYPQGADLYLHTLGTADGVLSIPLQMITGNLILSWNLLALAMFAASGLATYSVSHRVCGSPVGALVSAYIFAFSPFVMMAFQGHWNVSTTWPIPLFALFLLRFQSSGRLREAVGAGVAWAVLVYNNLEFAIDAGLFLGILLLYWSILYLHQKDWKRLRTAWLAAPVAAAAMLIVAAPLLIPSLISIHRGDVVMPGGTELFSSDLKALVTPSPLWGNGKYPAPVPPGLHHFPAGDIENTVYLGITPLIMGAIALLAIRRWRHPAVFWGLVFAFFVSMAMGPHLFIGDRKDFSLLGLHFTVPMPYQLYDRMPVISGRRGISRMIAFGILAMSVLAGLGVTGLMSWLRRHSHKRLAALAGLAVLGLVALEFWNPPVNVTKMERPAVFQEIGRDSGDFSVLHAPLGRSTWQLEGSQAGALLSDYYEPIYGKPTFGGYISRVKLDTLTWIGYQPGLEYLACPTCQGEPKPEDMNAAQVKRVLKQFRVKYIALHRISPNGLQVGGAELNALDAYLRNILQLSPVYTDKTLTLFRNPDVGG